MMLVGEEQAVLALLLALLQQMEADYEAKAREPKLKLDSLRETRAMRALCDFPSVASCSKEVGEEIDLVFMKGVFLGGAEAMREVTKRLEALLRDKHALRWLGNPQSN